MITFSNVLCSISNLKIQEKYIVIYVSYPYFEPLKVDVAYLFFLLLNCIVIFIHKQDCNVNIMLNEVTLCQ